ncbi:hypothetical protein CW362_22005 [Streptomyces populi]|uniref:Uncharacterized protein n=2 Tax=Streptomyces populi TaxID=2058924 RepID=A0A2I0SLY9_9ACTN|nr:hypothetical protein CW362_22005 [Streptomyces populi]
MLDAAQGMLNGSLTHFEAGNEIYWCACHLERTGKATELVLLFMGFWSNWEDRPDERAAIEKDMRVAAADLLRSHGEQVPEQA